MRLTPVVKNILIINIIVYLLQSLLGSMDLTGILALWKIGAENYAPYQYFTYMFAHGGLWHIAFNMLGLVFLGPVLEHFWGPKKFLIFYLVTGLGAGFIYNGIEFYRVYSIERQVEQYIDNPDPESFNRLIVDNDQIYPISQRIGADRLIDEYARNPEDEGLRRESVSFAQSVLYYVKNSGSMIGASGAIYGILMAFGLLFPNTELMLLFPPIPIKAKYLVLILGAIAIYSGLQRGEGDNVAHFAHLGGMIFAFIMIRYWRHTG